MARFYCGSCGDEAVDAGRSIDGKHHIVICAKPNPRNPGKSLGCGHVVGTDDPDELRQMLANSREAQAMRAHRAHTQSGRLPKHCPLCK